MVEDALRESEVAIPVGKWVQQREGDWERLVLGVAGVDGGRFLYGSGRRVSADVFGGGVFAELSHVFGTVEGATEGSVSGSAVGSVGVRCYRLREEGPGVEEVALTDTEEGSVGAVSWPLPSSEFEGLWESVWVLPEAKRDLLSHAETGMFFSSRGVDATMVSVNRLLLLHGPPGTGKTTLCKGLAQKLSIRLRDRFPHAVLLEINAHSLFSKWFSESGKLVARLFEQIGELVADPDCLVCVMVDEVESLTAARSAAIAGAEPSDAVRVVNALLTQLDALRRHQNVLILATSNLTHALDDAFLDRADLKLFVDLPNPTARAAILQSCLAELQRAGVVRPTSPHDLTSDPTQSAAIHAPTAAATAAATAKKPTSDLTATSSSSVSSSTSSSSTSTSSSTPIPPSHSLPASARVVLEQVVAETVGLSGRALRKLPFQAHASFLGTRTPVTTARFLQALLLAARKEKRDRRALQGKEEEEEEEKAAKPGAGE